MLAVLCILISFQFVKLAGLIADRAHWRVVGFVLHHHASDFVVARVGAQREFKVRARKGEQWWCGEGSLQSFERFHFVYCEVAELSPLIDLQCAIQRPSDL